MNKQRIELDSLILIGVTTRTNNKNEMQPEKSKIGELANAYWSQQIANAFNDRVNPGVTYSVYTEYENDEHGEYTYFLGEEVKSFDNQDHASFKSLIIPASTYQKFTTEPGKIPDIVISSWQTIWQMKEEDLRGQRKYIADFEVYDHRASHLDKAVVDIYIGIK